MIKIKKIHLSAGRVILGSFLFVIGMGVILLSLPMSRNVPIKLIDLFFTSTSATCITGLSTVPISSFTLFGKCVILALIQIGGLGLMTLTLCFASLFLNLGMATQIMAGQILEFESWGKIKNYLFLIVSVTFSFEILGAVYLYFQFKNFAGDENPIFAAAFHSIAAFCNSGITLYDSSMLNYAQKPLMLLGFGILMFAGSIGFIVWYDLLKLIKTSINKYKGHFQFFKLSLHSKIVLTSTVALTLIGGLAIWLLEYNNLFNGLSPLKSIPNALFCSLSARGVGFESINYATAHLSTLFFILPLMFIGASPGSTGSGVKTTTFVVFIATVFSIVRGRSSVELGGRRIPSDQIYKVMAIVVLAASWLFCVTFILLIIEQKFDFLQLLFEVFSAFGTCGLSLGITPNFSIIGKTILMITMLIGRIGSLTLVLSLRKRRIKRNFQYPEERIMIE